MQNFFMHTTKSLIRLQVCEADLSLCRRYVFPHFGSVSLGPVVQSIVSLTGSLVVKMLTVLVSTVSNSQVFSLKKCVNATATHIFSAITISLYAIFNDQSFNIC